MWTAENIESAMLEDLRRALAAADAVEHPRRWWLRQRLFALRKRLPRRGAIALATVAATCFAAAVAVLIIHWPVGGGIETSNLAITQGASLVFVVILLTLLPGALEAGRSIGWEAEWVLRDRYSWLGFTGLALLSLLELWIGWMRPEHAEEGATILLTACGLAITALVARRLLRLSDPAEQLRARVASQLPKLQQTVAEQRRKAAERVAQQEITGRTAQLLIDTPHPAIQQGTAAVLGPMLALTLRYAAEGRWDLALAAHQVTTQTMIAYIAAPALITPRDKVLELYCNRTNDLHELCRGPLGRDLATSLFTHTREVGIAITTSHEQLSLEDAGALQVVAFAVRAMLNRQVGDDRSEDAPRGLSVLTELAIQSVQLGDDSTAIGIARPLLELATPATNGRQAHLAYPAWRGAARLLAMLGTRGRDQAIRMWSGELVQAIEGLTVVPDPLYFSGTEPLLATDPEWCLLGAMHHVWEADVPRSTKKRVTLDLSRAVVQLADRSPDGHWRTDTVAEFLHQASLAALSAAGEDDVVIDSALDVCVNHLSHLRALWLASPDTNETLHFYVTQWVVVLFVLRTTAEFPQRLQEELHAWLTAVQEAEGDEIRPRREGIMWIAQALRRAHFGDAAEAVEAAQEQLPRSTGRYTHGLVPSGGAHLHRGLLIVWVVQAAEQWWLEREPEAEPDI